MKRFLFIIVAICAFFAVSAQRPLVTLSHDGTLSFFSTLSAFEDAIEAAADGDIIYLSEGQFTTSSETVIINKRLSIQGSGYKSHVLCHLLMDMRNVTSDEMDTPLFDGIRLRNIEFWPDSLNRSRTENVKIKKCYIEKVENGGYAANNIIFDRCWIRIFDAVGANNSNVTLQNSKINKCDWYLSEGSYHDTGVQFCTVINCNIATLKYLPKVTISSILGSPDLKASGSPVLYRTLLWHQIPSGATSYDCYENQTFSFNDNCEVDEAKLITNNWLGQDGTVVGVYGGETPFSENPSVPTVDSANSSVEYDAASNKLKVSITVKAD